MNLKSLLLLLALLCSLMVSALQRAHLVHYSVEDGLSQNTISVIMQDRKGFMWFGTWNGLNKFDGYNFTVYQGSQDQENSLVNKRIASLDEDSLGYIWVKTFDNQIYRFIPSTGQFESLQHLSPILPKEEGYRSLKISPSGAVWLISRKQQLFILQTDSTTRKVTAQEVTFGKQPPVIIEDIHPLSDGSTYILTSSGLFRQKLPGSTIEPISLSSIGGEQHPTAFLEVNGVIWIGTQSGKLFSLQKGQRHAKELLLSNSSTINGLLYLPTNELIITTASLGFYHYNLSLNKIVHLTAQNHPSLRSNEIISCFLDSHMEIWIQTPKVGVIHYIPSSQTLRCYTPMVDKTSPLALSPNFFIFEDKERQVWVHPVGGGFSYYDRKSQNLTYFYNKPFSSERKFSNLAHTAYSDRQGNLWISTLSKGLEKVSFFKDQFKLLVPNDEYKGLAVNEVRAVMQDSYGIIWVATKDASIYLYRPDKTLIGKLQPNGQIHPKGLFNDVVYSLYEDQQGDIWMGTKSAGLIRAKRGGNARNFTITHFENNPKEPYSISSNNIYDIIQDKNGWLWIGTFGGGLNVLDPNATEIRFINPNNKLKEYPQNIGYRIRDLSLDQHDNLCISTTNGLLVTAISNHPEESQFIHLNHVVGEQGTLKNNDIHCTLQTQMGLFVGSFGGGLARLTTPNLLIGQPKFESFIVHTNFTTDVVLKMIEDNYNNLWLTSENLIIKLNPTSVDHSERYSGLKEVEVSYFSESSICKTKSGEILCGSSDGLVCFYPDSVQKSYFSPPLVFTKLLLFNKEVGIGDATSPLQDHINHQDRITLQHDQSVFSIEYATLDFHGENEVLYAYKLEGFDTDWNYVQKRRNATFTNLPHGLYTFRVRSTNSEGVWVDNERQIEIEILPSFWETPWAVILYILTALGAIILTLYIVMVVYKLRNKVAVEQQISNLKLRFFTDISHELRTPLTLISGPLEYLMQHEQLSSSVAEQLHVVQTNVDRMLRLVNQILDFRKIQNNKLTLKVEEVILASLIQGVYINFTDLANQRHIDFRLIDNSQEHSIWVDKLMVEKVFFNLISNAFKFTPANSFIHVIINTDSNQLVVQVKDGGSGISKEKINTIFDRFSTYNDSSIDNTSGTGIGLSLTQEYVSLHDGIVDVESTVGVGTTFSVKLKTGLNHFGPQTEYIIHEEQTASKECSQQQEDETVTEQQAGDTKISILLVEDNQELREFLKKVLTPQYRVLEAEDGQQGIQVAHQEQPDMIISDLMMPKLNGLDMVKRLKEDENSSHIPIILLTAKSDIESKLSALEYGADDYITKPFNATYLEARVINLLGQRERIKKAYRSSILEQTPMPSIPNIPEQEDHFIQKMVQVVEDNIDNTEFSVDLLVSSSMLGRTVFFNKLKSLSGLAPVEFIRMIRMQRAKQLIESQQYTISQITYMVGFSDSRYLGKCFKQQFGITPSEYRDRCRQ